MKTAISIPDPTFKRAERAAKRLGVSRSEFFTRAVERMLMMMDDASITASYDAAFADAGAPGEQRFANAAAKQSLQAVEWDEP